MGLFVSDLTTCSGSGSGVPVTMLLFTSLGYDTITIDNITHVVLLPDCHVHPNILTSLSQPTGICVIVKYVRIILPLLLFIVLLESLGKQKHVIMSFLTAAIQKKLVIFCYKLRVVADKNEIFYSWVQFCIQQFI